MLPVAAALLLASAEATVCDTASQQKVPCFDLKSGSKIPKIAMGSWSGSYKDCESEDYTCVNQHARFAAENWLHMGGTHLDTANDYNTQTSLGAVLNSGNIKREEVFVTTKCPGPIGFAATVQCATDNLQMLGQFGTKGVQYIDLLLIHFPFLVKPACQFSRAAPECQPPNRPYEPASTEQLQETWKAMEFLKKSGVVKAIGVSDYNITNLEDTLKVATEPIDLHQVEWNPATHDEAMLEFCQKNNIQLQAWSPLGGSKGSVLSEDSIVKAAKAHNISTAQVTLRWSIQRGVAVVVGTGNAEHAKSDLDIFSFNLTDQEVADISAVQERAQSATAAVVV